MCNLVLMERLTDMQLRMLKAIERLGPSATLRTLQKELNYSSWNGVAKHITKLIQKGYIRRQKPVYNTLVVLHDSTEAENI